MNIQIKSSNKQKETAYVLYMILGSYFNRCTCRSSSIEKSFYMYYMEMRQDSQIQLEAKVIHEAERVLGEYAKTLSLERAEAYFHEFPDRTYQVLFQTGFEEISALVNQKGNFQIHWNPDVQIQTEI